MASAFDGTVVVAGGYAGSGLSGPTDRVFALRDDAWEELAPMPGPRGAGGAAEVDGRLVVAGGVGPAGLAGDAYVLDDPAGSWSTIDGPPTGREHLGVAGLEGGVYVVGGRTGGIGSNLDAAEVYDIETKRGGSFPGCPPQSGAVRPPRLPTATSCRPGGEEEGGTFAEVEAFDVRAGRWLSLPPMPTARHGLGVVAVGTVVYTIAGGTVPGLSVSDTVEAIDLASLSST
jgi:serine/threonine-protein kinase PknK